MTAQSCAIWNGKRLLGAAIAGWLSPVWLWASEGSAEAEGSVSPFAGDISTSIFTLVVFLILLVILWKFAWTPILTGLKQREQHIQDAITAAEKAKGESEEILKKQEQGLAQARQEAHALVEKARQEASVLAEQMRQETLDQAKQLRQQAQQDIEQARQSALRDIYARATDLATDLAGKVIGRSLSAEDHRALLQESLGQLQRKAEQN